MRIIETASDGLLDRVAASVAESLRFMTRTSHGEMRDDGGMLLYAMAPDGAVFWNGVVRTRPGPGAETLRRRAHDFFAPRGRGFSLLALEPRDRDLVTALAEQGRTPHGSEPQMALRTLPRSADPPDGVEIVEVRTPADAAAFVSVVARAFEGHGLDAQTVRAAYPDVASLADDGVLAQIASMDGRPAACGMAYLSDGVALLAQVGTIPAFRGRGLASSLTRSLCAAAARRGADLATLQASSAARRLYGRLGFETVGALHMFLEPRCERG